MTEEEAKTKWCPFARHQNGSNGVGINRMNWDTSYDYANCIASACMAWRPTVDPSANWHSEERQLYEERNGRFVPGGFCGLAGAPK